MHGDKRFHWLALHDFQKRIELLPGLRTSQFITERRPVDRFLEFFLSHFDNVLKSILEARQLAPCRDGTSTISKKAQGLKQLSDLRCGLVALTPDFRGASQSSEPYCLTRSGPSYPPKAYCSLHQWLKDQLHLKIFWEPTGKHASGTQPFGHQGCSARTVIPRSCRELCSTRTDHDGSTRRQMRADGPGTGVARKASLLEDNTGSREQGCAPTTCL